MSAGARSSELSLDDVLDLHKREILLATNCHALATVQAFDASTQLAKVTVNYKRKVSGVLYDYPPIAECPVIILGGGGGSIEFPITRGDTGLLCFNDRDMDNWITSGQTGMEPATARVHDFADAIFLCGVNAQSKAIADYSSYPRFRYGQTKIELSTTIKIANQTTDLKTILTNLIAHLSTAFGTPTPNPGTALNAAAVTALTADLTALGTLLT